MIYVLIVFLGLGIAPCLGCSDGWVQHGDSCYIFSHDEETWVGAMDVCTTFGGYLAEIETFEEDHYLSAQTKQKDGTYWIGLTDLDQLGVWQWMSSKDIVGQAGFTNWLTGKPDNHRDIEHCAYFPRHSRQWDDGDCASHFFYICEKPANDAVVVG